MNASSAPRPLFGDDNSVFEITKEQFCLNVVNTLNDAAESGGESIVASNPVEYLGGLTKGQLLTHATALGVKLGEIVAINVDDALLAEFRKDAEERKIRMIANTGELSSERANVRIMLQFDALDEVCASQDYSEEVPKRLRKFREQLSDRLSARPI